MADGKLAAANPGHRFEISTNPHKTAMNDGPFGASG
jgi:hypothetical protein